MRKNQPTKHIMSTQIQAVQQGQNLSETYQIMSSSGVHHVPVLNNSHLVGMVTSIDLICYLEDQF